MEPRSTVYAFAGIAAGVGGGLSPLPGADLPVLTALQVQMVAALAEHYGIALGKAKAAELVLTLGAGMAGRSLARAVVGLVPGWGAVVRAGTAAGVTVGIGHAAIAWFESRP